MDIQSLLQYLLPVKKFRDDSVPMSTRLDLDYPMINHQDRADFSPHMFWQAPSVGFMPVRGGTLDRRKLYQLKDLYDTYDMLNSPGFYPGTMKF